MSKNPKRGNTAVIVLLTVLIVLMAAATAFLIYLSIDLVNKEADVKPTQSNTMQLLPLFLLPPRFSLLCRHCKRPGQWSLKS